MVGGGMYVSLVNYRAQLKDLMVTVLSFSPLSFSPLPFSRPFSSPSPSLSLPQGSDHPVWY